MGSQNAGTMYDDSALDALSASLASQKLQHDKQHEAVNTTHKTDQHAAAADDTQAESNYSFDISALGSDVSAIDVERALQKIDSDDIGGPSDFTLNLAQYINDDHRSAAANAVPLSDSSSKVYIPPTVESVDTPTPVKPIVSPAEVSERATSQALASSQCLNGTLPVPEKDLQAQFKETQQHYNELLQRHSNAVKEHLRFRNDHEDFLKNFNIRLNRQTRELQQERSHRSIIGKELEDAQDAAKTWKRKFESSNADLTTQVAYWQAHARTAFAELDALRREVPKGQDRAHAAAARPDPNADLVKHLEQKLVAQKKEFHDTLRDKVKESLDFSHRGCPLLVEKYQAEIDRLNARIRDLEHMFTTCGKELMQAWGRLETGVALPGQRQQYRYRQG